MHNQSSSYPQEQRPIRGTTKPQIYIPKERRCINLSMKEDRQPRNRLSLLFHISPATQRSTSERRTYQVFIDIQVIHHEKPTLEVREVTKLLGMTQHLPTMTYQATHNQSSSYPQHQ